MDQRTLRDQQTPVAPQVKYLWHCDLTTCHSMTRHMGTPTKVQAREIPNIIEITTSIAIMQEILVVCRLVWTIAEIKKIPRTTQCHHTALASVCQGLSELLAESRKSSICSLCSIATVRVEPKLQKVIPKQLCCLKLRNYNERWISLRLSRMSVGWS